MIDSWTKTGTCKRCSSAGIVYANIIYLGQDGDDYLCEDCYHKFELLDNHNQCEDLYEQIDYLNSRIDNIKVEIKRQQDIIYNKFIAEGDK